MKKLLILALPFLFSACSDAQNIEGLWRLQKAETNGLITDYTKERVNVICWSFSKGEAIVFDNTTTEEVDIPTDTLEVLSYKVKGNTITCKLTKSSDPFANPKEVKPVNWEIEKLDNQSLVIAKKNYSISERLLFIRIK
jgi:hypothetical protein